jgi:hypothetical protein
VHVFYTIEHTSIQFITKLYLFSLLREKLLQGCFYSVQQRVTFYNFKIMKQVVGAIEKFSFSLSCDTYSYVCQPSSSFFLFTVRRYEDILSIVILNVPGYICSSNYKLAVLMSNAFLVPHKAFPI